MSTTASILVLGPPDVADPDPQMLAPRLSRLLGLLVVSRCQPVRTPALVERLWPDSVPPSGESALRVYVTRLRRILGDPCSIVASPGRGYQLSVGGEGGVALDVDQFDEAIRRGDCFVDRDRGEASRWYRSALAYWRGPPFDGCDDDADVVAVRTSIENKRRHAVRCLCRCLLGAEMASDTLSELHSLVAADPGDENLALMLMTHLAERGHQVDALRVYRRIEAHLCDELDVPPSQPLRLLADQIHLALRSEPNHAP